MSKKYYSISVNGTTYEVEVTEKAGPDPAVRSLGSAPVYAAPAPVAAPAPAPAPVAAPAPAPAPAPAAAPAPAGAGSVTCPMPGSVLSVNVAVGDSVTAGQAVIILEAMKMEIEVAATANGKVKSIAVSKGAVVNTGDVLLVIE